MAWTCGGATSSPLHAASTARDALHLLAGYVARARVAGVCPAAGPDSSHRDAMRSEAGLHGWP